MKMIKLFANGIAWGCTICTFVLIIGAVTVGDSFLAMTAGDFIRQSIGAMIVGVGFVVPTIIYSKEGLSTWMQTIIHMGIGILIYLLVAFNIGWIPVASGWKMCALSILIALITSFIFWTGFYLYSKKEAKILNQKLESMK